MKNRLVRGQIGDEEAHVQGRTVMLRVIWVIGGSTDTPLGESGYVLIIHGLLIPAAGQT